MKQNNFKNIAKENNIFCRKISSNQAYTDKGILNNLNKFKVFHYSGKMKETVKELKLMNVYQKEMINKRRKQNGLKTKV